MTVRRPVDDHHLTPELRLLLACARPGPVEAKRAAIEALLADGVDWTVFAGQAVDHGLVRLTAHTLALLTPENVPDDILAAFRAVADEARWQSRALFEELARLLETLTSKGIEAIPFKGPVLAIKAFGDMALRSSRDLDLLVRDADLAETIAALGSVGYKRKGELTDAQFELIHRLQGQEVMFNEVTGTAVEPHTRLTSLRMALDIDHTALFHRARRQVVDGHSFLMLGAEDTLLVLAIHGGKEMWWNLKWACDFAAWLEAHPKLDWNATAARARAQGCLRMLLLATSLGRRYFHAAVPHEIVTAERADRIIEPMVGRILAGWQAPLNFSPDNNAISGDRLRLHDGLARRVRYVSRTLLLPGPHHVAAMPLPRSLRFAYTPIKLAHDAVALPLWRFHRGLLAQMERLPYLVAEFPSALAVIAGNSDVKRSIGQLRRLRADAMRALADSPNSAGAWRDLGDAFSGLRRYKKAIASYDRALSLAPHNTTIRQKRLAALRAVGRDDVDAEPEPRDAKGWAVEAGALFGLQRYAEAVEASDRALALDADDVDAARIGIQARLRACDWRRRDEDERSITEGVKAGRPVIRTFYHRSISDSESESLILARFVRLARPRAALWSGERYAHDKIRVAYCSTDFRDQVVADVIIGCLERHDKSRFDLTALSLGPDDGSEKRQRVAAAFDRFIDVQRVSDSEAAGILRELEIDLVVDLNGNAGEGRRGIFAHRPAPVQVTFLGYPGTTGLPFIDYIIADRVVVPPEHRMHYSEKVVYLPHTYMPTDNTRKVAVETPGRVEAGLPPTGFVFACHNHEYKFSPEVFDVWMRLLKKSDDSVLWLKSLHPEAMINLRREASAHGVAPERLIFAPRVARAEDHLARLRLADLFLDTRPYNAHATACDALWVGLPVVTYPGNTFPARVGASLLGAIGMSDLVARSLAEYEELASALARDRDRLAAIKTRLMRNRETEPLFDTARFTGNLESAYVTMWERQQNGQAMESFAVDESSSARFPGVGAQAIV
jgi:protein O-GlcNAc transferase